MISAVTFRFSSEYSLRPNPVILLTICFPPGTKTRIDSLPPLLLSLPIPKERQNLRANKNSSSSAAKPESSGGGGETADLCGARINLEKHRMPPQRNDAPFPLQIAEYRPDNCKIPITFRLKYDIIHLRFCFAPFCLVLTEKTAQNIQKSYGNRPSDRTPSPVQNIIFKDIPVYYITQNRRFQHLNHIKITHRRFSRYGI